MALARIRSMNRDVQLGALVTRQPLEPVLSEPGVTQAVCAGRDVLSREAVVRIRGAGLACYAWTINEPAHMDRLVEWRVDGIITDRPALLRVRLGR
jgi:glycerophosphoryl diester phosphodiesterase